MKLEESKFEEIQLERLTETSDFRAAMELLEQADIQIGGNRPWDIHIKHPDTIKRIFSKGSLGFGESYVDGWWDCYHLDQLMDRILRSRIDEHVISTKVILALIKNKIFNRQSINRAWQVGREHYDLGNDLYEAMLDPYMAYSCGYWNGVTTLEQAQEQKLDIICKKLGLQSGMKLLDIGCGWGSLMRFAAEHYGVSCVGLTISAEQAAFGNERMKNLPVRFELADYRLFNADGSKKFDRVASVGMFEHVGHKNYNDYFAMAKRNLCDDGLFLLHTIGKNVSDVAIDPWIEKYIFTNGSLPSAAELAKSCEHDFVIEDWHSFGSDYDKTLMAWHQRFEQSWPQLQKNYGQSFYRMWNFYLLSCAGSFRARSNQLWQVVLSPKGLVGGYKRPSL
jgi:cyclopropane-fatty-acyl-phospholipid synthase